MAQAKQVNAPTTLKGVRWGLQMGGRSKGSMQIGQIAAQTGVGIDAIRFYERNGLLAAPARSRGGFRLYSSNDLSSLQFIRRLQTLGFS